MATGKQLKDFDSAGTISDSDVLFAAQGGVEKKMTAAQLAAYVSKSGVTTSIASTAVAYQASASGTVTPTGTWVPTIPAVTKGQNLWTRTTLTLTDSSTVTSYSVAYQGADGAAGSGGTTGTVTATVQNLVVYTTPGAGTFSLPTTATAFAVAEAWGAAGGPGYGPGSGGGGGAYSAKNNPSFTPGGTNVYNFNIGAPGASGTSSSTAGAAGGDTWVLSASVCLAKGGSGGVQNSTAAVLGGQASAGIGDVKYSGGSGGGADAGGTSGGGGGSAATPTGNGGNGAQGSETNGAAVGGTAPGGGAGGLPNLSNNAVAPTNGADNQEGGGGGGGCSDTAGGVFNYAGNGGFPGGAGGSGQYNKGSGTSKGGQVRFKYTTSATYTTTGTATFYLGIAGLLPNEVAQIFSVGQAFVLKAGLSGSSVVFATPATAQTVYTLYRNGSAIATATIAAGATTATLSMTSDAYYAAGDVLKLQGPATADATLATGTWTLVGVLVQ
jgi:hypothetical protein